LKAGFSTVALPFLVIFSSCAVTDKIFQEESCVEGTLYIIGNEPFTHLAIEADSACSGGQLASLIKKKDMYVLSGKEGVMLALYKYQGKKARVFFKRMRVSADGNSILVSRFEIAK